MRPPGAARRRFLTNAGEAVAVFSNSLIRCVRCVANAASFCGHRVPDGSRAFDAKAELAFMLPGLRFLFVAIVLSMSMLVFGLGAAALLRAAHEEFATNPSWHATPETMFAQRSDATRPVLAMLRVEETPAVEQPQPPQSDSAPAAAPAEPMAIEAAPADQTAALKVVDSPPPEPSTPQIPVEATSAPIEPVLALAPTLPETPAATAEEKPLAEIPSPASQPDATPPAQMAPPVQASAPTTRKTEGASSKIAALGGAAATVEPTAKSDRKTVKIKKRKHAKRKVHRRRIAVTASAAGEAFQPTNNPFGQQPNR